MARAELILANPSKREQAIEWCRKAPQGTSVTFRPNKRTLPQNSLMWSLLTSVAMQVEWYGQKLTAEDWKDMFTASLRKARVVPGLDPGNFVVLGLHTSQMDKEEMTNLIELILAFGAERGVEFYDHEQGEAHVASNAKQNNATDLGKGAGRVPVPAGEMA